MRYQGDEALGLIETLGMGPALYGADAMLKAASVDLVAYENVGSTLVTIMVKGDVAAVQAAVAAGIPAASSIGKLTASNIMPRPARAVASIAAVHAIDDATRPPLKALGLIETFGVVFLMQAADAMTKAADVELLGYENVASGYVSVLVEGDVAAVQAAVEAGLAAVAGMGATPYSSFVIPMPHHDMGKIVQRYTFEKLFS